MKDLLPYLPLLNLLVPLALWVLNDIRNDMNDIRNDIKELRAKSEAHDQAIAQLRAADAIRHPGQQPAPLTFRASAGGN